MRRLWIHLLLGAAAVVLCAAPASADTACAMGSVCSVQLTQTNVSQLAGVVVTVTIDNTGANTVLSFQLTTNPVSTTNTALGIDMVGWNTGTISGFASGWSGSPSGSMDGFGTFTIQAQNGGSTDGISSPVSFTLNGIVTNFAANSSGNEFVVHVRFDGNAPDTGCSGFVGGQTGTSSQNSDTGCGTPVPEPGTLALFGTGMLGLAGIIRRRLLG